jgi:NADP-dependent 3-hydroxy acid dehydrogenase YdfG
MSKVILITGASSGIGEAIAIHLAKQGHKVVLGARRTERLQKLTEELQAESLSAAFRELDVTRLDDMQAFVAFAEDRYGPADVIINNAGVMPLSPLNALKVDEWNRMIDMRCRPPQRCTARPSTPCGRFPRDCARKTSASASPLSARAWSSRNLPTVSPTPVLARR